MDQLSFFIEEGTTDQEMQPELVAINTQVIVLERLYLRVKKRWIDTQSVDRYPQSFIDAESFFHRGKPSAETVLWKLKSLDTWMDNMAAHDWTAAQ